MTTMTLKDVIKLEDKAKEVWVISPSLHYDVDNKNFNELVSVNLGQKTKYRYIVPATKQIKTNIEKYKKTYKVSEADIAVMFCIVSDSDFIPFINELAIYNGNTEPISVSTPPLEDNNEVIKYNKTVANLHAKSFKEIWKKYKRSNP
jgi:hypothetical protein